MLSSLMPGAVFALMALDQLVVPTLALPQGSSFWSLKTRQQQEAGTPLFLDEPSCDFYQCAVTYYPGDNATAHWLDAPAGNVVLTMLSHSSNITDQVVATVPGTTTNCDSEGSSSCGQFSWIVPSSWAGGNFTLQAQSSSDPSMESYTDTILIMTGNATSNSANVAFSALGPTISGSSTVGGSTSTVAVSSPTMTSGTITSAVGGAASTAQTTNTAPTSSSSSSTSSNTSNAADVLQAPLLLLSSTLAFFIALCL